MSGPTVDPRDETVLTALAPSSADPGSPPPSPGTDRRWGPLEQLSLRTRLVGILVSALLVALAATGYGVQAVLSSYLTSQVKGQLDDAYRFALRENQPELGDEDQGGRERPTLFASYLSYDSHPTWNQLAGGPAGGSTVHFPVVTSTEAARLNGAAFQLQDNQGHSWLAVSVPKVIERDGVAYSGSLTQAISLESTEAAVDKLRLVTVLIGLVVMALCAMVGWLAIRRSFRPLLEMEETAAAIAAGDLSRRVPEQPASTEVGRLTASLNSMLTQIESAFRAQAASEARTRRFAADASHELRTPLASIRGFAELYRQGAVPDPEVPRTLRRIEDEAKRMGSLVEDLLLLARLDEQRPGRHDPVDLTVLAGDAVHDARGLDASRTVRLIGLEARPGDNAGPDPTLVTGDEDRLRQVVSNLMANAIRHTPEGTPVEVAVGLTGEGRARIEVRDHGPGLDPEQTQRVFERFYRVDASRQRGHGGGSGLGLSIVAAVVTAHGGQVQVEQTPGGGATFGVELPAEQAAISSQNRPGHRRR